MDTNTLIGSVDTKLTNDIETTRNNSRALDRRMDRLEADVKALMVHLGVEPVAEE